MRKEILILLILLISCSQKEKNINVSTADKWIEFKTNESIPKPLYLALSKLDNVDFKIANSNERFNATDLLIDSLPSRQLRLLAKKNDKWRMTYIQGGFGKYYVYIECKIHNDSILDFKIAESLSLIENNDTIDKLLSEHKLKFINVNR